MHDIDPHLPATTAVPQLVDLYGDRLLALGRRICRTREDAEDLIQEVFLLAFRKWNQFEGRSKASTWLFTIAVRQCQRRHRLRVGEPSQLESWDDIEPFAETIMVDEGFLNSNLGSDSFRDEKREAMERAIVDLPIDYRMPLLLKDIAGLSVAEVASLLDLTEGSVKTRVYRARLKLRKVIIDDAPTDTVGPSIYTKQVCADLLDAKQQALDKGVEFPLDEVLCERCRTVFKSLDLAVEVCRSGAMDELSTDARDEIRRRLMSEAE